MKTGLKPSEIGYPEYYRQYSRLKPRKTNRRQYTGLSAAKTSPAEYMREWRKIRNAKKNQNSYAQASEGKTPICQPSEGMDKGQALREVQPTRRRVSPQKRQGGEIVEPRTVLDTAVQPMPLLGNEPSKGSPDDGATV
jgi:hypothetical protein